MAFCLSRARCLAAFVGWIAAAGAAYAGDGLARYDGGKLRLFTTADGLSSDRVRIAYQDPLEAGTLWLGTFDDGVNRFRDGVFTRASRRALFAVDGGP